MAGLEVDATEPLGQGLDNVVVAEIIAAEQHPDADKLRVCQVQAGAEQFQIVCGAPNARVGIKVPLAKIGAKLPGDFKIKKAKLRGVESQGMLCAQTELQLGEDDAGLWELPLDAAHGTPLAEFLGLPDTVIDIDLTPNRSDCLSVAGIAREVGVLNRCELTPPAMPAVDAVIDDTFPVSVEASADCPRYLGRVIRNVDLNKPTPVWMQERLRRAGMRSLDPAVDVTNYVMLELGQPLHAFDLATLSQGIKVRKAAEGEKITLLDGQEVTLNSDSLLIADHDKPLALAGIMGGEGSGVSDSTKDLFLEAAFFAPLPIAGRARSFGLHTESSHRFERGVDPALAAVAIERATQLLLDIVGGEPGPVTEAVSEADLPEIAVIELKRASIPRLLGFELADSEVEDILSRLGLSLEASSDGWKVTVPSARFDVSIEADLLEELARIYGYNNLPTCDLVSAQQFTVKAEGQRSKQALRQSLVDGGYQEVITYSFIDPEWQAEFEPEAAAVSLQNPIASDMAVMRTSLLPALVRTLDYNVKRQQSRLKLFETGQRFVPAADGSLKQEETLAMLAFGPRLTEGWANSREKIDFYDLKGDLEALLATIAGNAEVSFAAGTHSAMHPGQCAQILINAEVVGHIGALHPRISANRGLPQGIYLLEADLDVLLQTGVPSYEKISKFPEVRRDLAIIIKGDIPASDIELAVRDTAGPQLAKLTVFDVYTGKGIPEGEKSLGLGLTLQDHSRTLTEEDVNECIDRIVAQLTSKFGATLRN
jgi:phenylalanyl-tRNA synthetase beta chain